MNMKNLVPGVLLVLGLSSGSFSQTELMQQRPRPCGQERTTQNPLIDEADRNGYVIRRIEIAGNSMIRHHEFVKRMAEFNEGRIFTRRNFEAAIKNISKMKPIFPIAAEDAEIRIDPQSGNVDILFCVTQRPVRN